MGRDMNSVHTDVHLMAMIHALQPPTKRLKKPQTPSGTILTSDIVARMHACEDGDFIRIGSQVYSVRDPSH